MAASDTDQPTATITLEVFRYRPEDSDEPTFQSYDVPYREDWETINRIAMAHLEREMDNRNFGARCSELNAIATLTGQIVELRTAFARAAKEVSL